MQKYEYQTFEAKSPEVNEAQLNKMGDLGWLLVAVYQRPSGRWVYIFARELIEQ